MRKKILLADDSATSLFRQQMLLQETGHELCVAHDGAEAVEAALRELPDLILLDVEMPKMNGFEACSRLREFEETRETPIIMVTSRSEKDYVDTGYRSGCNDFVFKPVEGPELLSKVKTYLDPDVPR